MKQDRFDISENGHEEIREERGLVPQASRDIVRPDLMPSIFDERRLEIDIWRGALGGEIAKCIRHWQAVRDRRRETDLLVHWASFYRQAADTARARREYELATIEALSVGDEAVLGRKQHQLRLAEVENDLARVRVNTRKVLAPPSVPYGHQQTLEKELEVQLARMDAEIDELRLRSARAKHESENVADFVVPPQREVPRRKPSVDEVRQRKVRRQQVALDDQLALKLDRVRMREKIREHLAAIATLDEDERERLEQQLVEELEAADEPDGKTL